MTKRSAIWLTWAALTAGLGLFLAQALSGERRSLFLPGETSHGHYQIELACDACHTEPFGGLETLQDACVGCHGAELKAAKDTHPKSKFTDPRNADRLQQLDARYCITCHQEHRPEITGKMGLTLSRDFCIKCHRDVSDDRSSHNGMDFFTCADAGCHNYHDNRALYEDFLLQHADTDNTKADARLHLTRTGSSDAAERISPLTAADEDAPDSIVEDHAIIAQWAASAHAAAGVNCSGCHQPSTEGGKKTPWRDRPDYTVCADCHDHEAEGFLTGRHGMRLAQGLPAITTAQARVPMADDAGNRTLHCNACHGAHGFDVKTAAVESCLDCHADRHSKAYRESPHRRLWLAEMNGEAAAGTGVSCATCHLPRQSRRQDRRNIVFAQHNQNFNLRPNEKMIRSVCLDCHGLAFSIDALADDALILDNFVGTPRRHVESIDMAVRRDERQGDRGP